MASFDKLPSDVLFEIFSLFDSLRDLWSVSQTCRSVSDAFYDRRPFLLKQVLSRQLVNLCETRGSARKHPSYHKEDRCRILHTAQHAVRKCDNEPQLAMLLHTSSIETILGLHPGMAIDCCWSLKLLERLSTASVEQDHFEVVHPIWQGIIGGGKCHHKGCIAKIAEGLAILCVDRDQPDAAMLVVREYLDMVSERSKCETALLVKLTRHCHTNRIPVPNITAVYQERIIAERRAMLSEAQTLHNAMFIWPHHWSLSLSAYESQVGHQERAAATLEDAVEFSLQHSLPLTNSRIPYLSRKLITIYKSMSSHEGLRNLYRRVFDYLLAQGDHSLYMVWGQDYARCLRLAGDIEEAIIVEERVWSRITAEMIAIRNRGMIYSVQNAARALVKAYERAGKSGEAAELQRTQQGLLAADRKHDWNAGQQWPALREIFGV